MRFQGGYTSPCSLALPLQEQSLSARMMSPPSYLSSDVPKPILFEPTSQVLGLEATLGELPLYQFEVEADQVGGAIAQRFEQMPQVPGVVLLEDGCFLGMVSRQRFLECLIRPHGLDLFLAQPLRVLYSYARRTSLILPQDTPILLAAQQALRRSPDQQAEPILVQLDAHTYRLLDVHDLNIAYWQIRGIETQVRYERAQAQIVQSEKMAGLGRLVDGVAHEILDPVGFIWGNLAHVESYTAQILELLAAYEAQLPDPPAALLYLRDEIELDYLKEDLPRAIESIRTGADRLRKLASSLQNFCHIDDVYPKPADLHECLDSILLLLKSRLSHEIEIVKDYGHLPPVTCFIGQLSQVFMNILTNAANSLLNQAVYQEWAGEFGRFGQLKAVPASTETKPQITVSTQVRSLSKGQGAIALRWVVIRIADNGPGFSVEQHQRLLESFSVQKRSAKETSLAVSYRIVTAKHGGKFYVRSPITPATVTEPAGGTEFQIWLPLA